MCDASIKLITYPPLTWSQRQLASMTTLPFLVVQLPLAVHDCHVMPGWVSVCSVPTSWPRARERREAAKTSVRYMIKSVAAAVLLKLKRKSIVYISIAERLSAVSAAHHGPEVASCTPDDGQ